MRELTTQTGIVVKCSKTAIEFFQNAQSVDFFSVLEIPEEFQGIAVEFYDLIMENDHLAALLGCRGNYDIAIQIDEVTDPITEEELARRISLTSLSVTSGGSFTAWFDCDEMFTDHAVTVYGSLKKGLKTANIEG